MRINIKEKELEEEKKKETDSNDGILGELLKRQIKDKLVKIQQLEIENQELKKKQGGEALYDIYSIDKF